jgi:hypothetical protein
MQSSGARAVIAAIGLIVAALVYADAQSSLADQAGPTPSHRSSAASLSRVGEVEVAIARTNVAAQMETALGDDFGGVWFEPSIARLHVGVTSSASRRSAEAVAVKTGLSEVVTETQVGSTWPQLVAAQERWGRRLADLFKRGLVKTWISAQDNAVGVELASTVPQATRAELEREASAEEHNLAPNSSCAAITKQKTNGTYTGEELITGESKAGAHIGILVTPFS